jgi:hypothetical protein
MLRKLTVVVFAVAALVSVAAPAGAQDCRVPVLQYKYCL